MRTLFGVPVYTLSEAVENFNIESGNVRGHHFTKMLVHAKWVWQDLLLNTIWSFSQKILEVDKVNNTVKLPDNRVRLINISAIDKHGNAQPLAYNPNFNTQDVACPPKTCGCPGCGCNNTLCGLIDAIQYRTETVYLNGIAYTKEIWTRKDANGLVEVSKTPFLDNATVVYEEFIKKVCDLEMTSNGCIKFTEPNRKRIVEHCGCYFPIVHRHMVDVSYPPYESYFGDFNWDSVDKDVLHLKHVKAERLLVTYQTNGMDDGSQINIPEHAVSALQYGIMHRQAAFSTRTSTLEKRNAKNEYNNAKNELFEFENPLKISDFVQLQETIAKW